MTVIPLARRGTLLAFVGVLVLSPDTLLMRLSGLQGWDLMAWRGLVQGFAMLLGFCLWYGRNSLKMIAAMRAPEGLAAIFCLIISAICFNFAITLSSVSLVLTCLATMPLMTALIAIPILREIPDKFTWGAILIAMIGVVIVVMDADNAHGAPSGNSITGTLLALASGFFLSMETVMIRHAKQINMVPATALGSIIAGLLAIAMGGTLFNMGSNITVLLMMTLIVLPVSLTLLALAPRYTMATTVSLLLLLETVLGPFWVWLGVGEAPSLQMLAGSALVVGTLVAYTLHQRRSSAP